jgi:hypothetical protein
MLKDRPDEPPTTSERIVVSLIHNLISIEVARSKLERWLWPPFAPLC